MADIAENNNSERAHSDKPEETLGTRERFSRMLMEYADGIKSVRNDVFTTQWWQLALNFFFGLSAVALLVVSMAMSGTVATVGAILGVVLVIILIVYNLAMRAFIPTSFLQYTCFDKGNRYCLQVLSKTRTSFSDGKNFIEVDRGEAVRLAEVSYGQFRFDFFRDMSVDMRIVTDERETFKGTFEHNGKIYKSRIVFKNGTPLFGSVGGARIKYFDVNNTKDKFVVPADIKRAAKQLNVDFPKLPGLYIRDDIKDARKQ